MNTRESTLRRPARSAYWYICTSLTAVLGGVMLSLAAVSITWAQISPGDEIEPPPETTGWKFTELVSRDHDENAFNPDIATGLGGRQFVAWVETVTNTLNRKLFFSHRAAGYGQSWSTPSLIAEITLEHGWDDMPCPSLAAGGSDLLHVVWSVSRTDSTGGIYYKKYHQETETWEPATQVVSGIIKGCPRLIAEANDNLHLVWAQSDGVYYRAFDKNLNGWLEVLRLSETAETYSAPALAMGGNGSLHVAWVAGRAGSESALYYRNRNPGVPWFGVQLIMENKPATNCGANTRLKDYPAYISPGIAADKDGNVYLAWTQMICRRISVNNVPEAHILYKRYSASGWTAEEDISGPRPQGLADRNSTAPDLALTWRALWPVSAASKAVLHVVWKEKTWFWASSYTNRILYRNYASASGSWSEPFEVQKFDEPMQTGQFVEFSRPAVSVDSGLTRGVTVHTTWAYKTGLLDSGPDVDVFYRRYVHTTPLVRQRKVIYTAIIALLAATAAIYGYRRYRSRMRTSPQ